MSITTKIIPDKAPRGGFVIGLEVEGVVILTAWGFTKYEARKALSKLIGLGL